MNLPYIAAERHTPMIEALPLLGIEEEYLIVDPLTRHVVPRADDVLRAASGLGDEVAKEITRLQVEARTAPSTDLRELAVRLRGARRRVARAARSCGLDMIACGIPILGPVVPPPLSEGDRYQRGADVYGALNDEISICALHVHVDVPDVEHAVLVGNHVRPWLPTLIALTANSPFFAGRDTGYASWRVISWGRWPVAGAPPYFASYAGYQRLLATLVESGALMDARTVFWDVRPSCRLPTVEIRVADVPLAVEDSLTVVGLVRGLVVTALTAIARGDLGPPIPAEVLRVAYWRAARDGLYGEGLDVEHGTRASAATLARRLLDHVRPALAEIGDLPMLERGLTCLLARGSGAVRQRRAYDIHHNLPDVVDDLIRATVA